MSNELRMDQDVFVLRKIEGDNRFSTVHRGRIVGLTDSFAQVFRRKMKEDDTEGDVSRDTSEWFPIESNRIRVIPREA